MFTGIVQSLGHITSIAHRCGDCQLGIDLSSLGDQKVARGDSIAVNGVCLTAVDFEGESFLADVSVETLAITTLGELKLGSRVNLELALTLGSRLGGHLVSGHIDGIGEVVSRCADARSERFTFRIPVSLSRYIAVKGSICVEGISLTVNTIEKDYFSVNIVPHTLQTTTLDKHVVGTRVNLEADIIARYLERLSSAQSDNHK